MNVTSPASGDSWPRMILSSVDLPAPFGPTSPTRSPDRSVSETSSNNSRPPNDFESPATVNMARCRKCFSFRANMLPHKLLHTRQIYKCTRRQYAHALIILLIEMAARGVDGDDEIHRYGQRTFQKTIVRLVADDVEFGQRITQLQIGQDALQQFGLV